MSGNTRATECARRAPTTRGGVQPRSTNRPSAVAAMAWSVVALIAFVGIHLVGPAAGAETPVADTGFAQPFAGPEQYLPFADTELTDGTQLNAPIGLARGNEIAAGIGLSADDAFTPQQYQEFITGQGVGGDPTQAELVDKSVAILTNTIGRPLPSDIDGQTTGSVLASYGLFVNETGAVMSPANDDVPTRQVNEVIAPGGYLGTWCQDNGCEHTVEALYASAYQVEVVYGLLSQQISGAAQLAPNTKNGVVSQVGMSMAPSIWLTNFALLYALNPDVAAAMPAYWAPIPSNVADAIVASPNGQVPYCTYASSFGASAPSVPINGPGAGRRGAPVHRLEPAGCLTTSSPPYASARQMKVIAPSILAFRDGNVVCVDRDAFRFAQPSSGEDALHDVVLSRAVLVDVDRRRSHVPLHAGVFVTELCVTSQHVPDREMIPERERTRDHDVRLRTNEALGLPECPPLRDAQFPAWLEPEFLPAPRKRPRRVRRRQ